MCHESFQVCAWSWWLEGFVEHVDLKLKDFEKKRRVVEVIRMTSIESSCFVCFSALSN